MITISFPWDTPTYFQNTQNSVNPAGNCMLKVSNRNTRTKYEVCSKLTIKASLFLCIYC